MKIRYLPIVFLLFIITACANKGSIVTADTTLTYTSYAGLSALMEQKEQGSDFYLIDVRTSEEYEAGHIPSAHLIPYDILSANMPTDDHNALIILYCRSGRRAGVALDELSALGYNNIHNFGGISKWEGEIKKGPLP